DPLLTSGTDTLKNLSIDEDTAPISLGLESLTYSAGPGEDTEQELTYTINILPSSSLGTVTLADGTPVRAGSSYTIEQINGLKFDAAENAYGTSTFEFSVTDSGVLQAPVDGAPGSSFTVTVNGQSLLQAELNTLSDIDGDGFTGVSLTQEVFNQDDAGYGRHSSVRFAYTDNNGGLVLTRERINKTSQWDEATQTNIDIYNLSSINSNTGSIQHDGPVAVRLIDTAGSSYSIPAGFSLAATRLSQEISTTTNTWTADQFQIFLKNNTSGEISQVTFSIDGLLQGSSIVLDQDQINKINVQSKLDLSSSGTVGVQVNTELFNPNSNGGSYDSWQSPTRWLYNTSGGILISKDSLATGSDLRNQGTNSLNGAQDGPQFTLVASSDLNLSANQSVAGVRRLITGNANTGFELIIQDPANAGQVRLVATDNDGNITGTSTLDSSDLRLRTLELAVNSDLNGDGSTGFNVQTSDLISNQPNGGRGTNTDTGRYVSLTTDGAILISRETLPNGNLSGLSSSQKRYDQWSGSSTVVLATSDGSSALNLQAGESVLGSRVIRQQASNGGEEVTGAQLFIADTDGNIKALDFSFDGTNSGIATLTNTNTLTADQISSLEVETGFDLNNDSYGGLKAAAELYRPTQDGGSSSEGDRYVFATDDGKVALTRNAISGGSTISFTNNWDKTVILSDTNGDALNVSDLSPTTASNILGARTIIFTPDGWPEDIQVNSALAGFSLYLGGATAGTADVISFDPTGKEVSRSTLSGEALLSAEVRENLDLNADGVVGVTIGQTLFSPNGGGSDRRHVFSSDQGLIVSRESIIVGSDLKGVNSWSDTYSGPAQLRLTNNDGTSAFSLSASESVVGAHTTWTLDLSSAYTTNKSSGVVLYLQDSTTNSVRAAAFDLNGQFIDSTEVKGNELVNAEIRANADINADGFTGAQINNTLYAPTNPGGASNTQRYAYSTSKGLILSKDALGGSGSSISANNYWNGSWDGPTILALDQRIAFSNVSETIASARLIRTPLAANPNSELASGFELYIRNNTSSDVRVVTLNLDGSLANINKRSIDQSVGITIKPINDAPTQSGSTALSGQATEDTNFTLYASELLASVTDVDNDTLTISGPITADHGSVKGNTDGTYTYTPEADFYGTVTFSFSVIDGNGGTVTASQTL
ncbi:MAG: hypothetical protein DCO99_12645, partial [Synechococcus sp. XM-24]